MVFTKADVYNNQEGVMGEVEMWDAITATESFFHLSLTCTQELL